MPGDLEALFPGGVPVTPIIPLRRGAALLSETLPALLQRIVAVGGHVDPTLVPRPLRLRRAKLPPGCDAHVVIVAAPNAACQAAFLALVVETRGRSVHPGAVGAKARMLCSSLVSASGTSSGSRVGGGGGIVSSVIIDSEIQSCRSRFFRIPIEC
jgi:hypothetical protein